MSVYTTRYSCKLKHWSLVEAGGVWGMLLCHTMYTMQHCIMSKLQQRLQNKPLQSTHQQSQIAACKQQTKTTLSAVTNPQVVSSELIMRRPWFVGGSDLDILGKIFQAFGTPSEAQWPGMKDLPNFVEFQKTEPPPLASIVKGVSLQGLLPLHPSAATHKSCT